MPWFKVDDKLHDHRKARAAKKAAIGVWVLAGSWCMDNLTDGFVPEDVLPRWGTRADAAKLVEAGLWVISTRNGEKGWQFHDWDRFQPSAAVTEQIRVKEAEAGVRGNHKRWHKDRGIVDPNCEYCYRVPDQEPDGVPDRVSIGGGESAPIPPVPVPEPDYSVGDGKPSAEANSATLIAEWIDRCAKRPPGRVIGQVGKELKAMLEEGIGYETVRAGLAAWHKKGLHPATLASVVHEQQSRETKADDGGYFAPFVPPPCPPEIADDPARYEVWIREQGEIAQQQRRAGVR